VETLENGPEHGLSSFFASDGNGAPPDALQDADRILCGLEGIHRQHGEGNGGMRTQDKGPKPETVELHHIQMGRDHEGIKLTKYGNKISLNPYFELGDGRRYMRFCYPKIKDGPSTNHYPMGVDIGKNFKEAIDTLMQFVTILKGEMERAGQNPERK
jgi:hypothetical protein